MPHPTHTAPRSHDRFAGFFVFVFALAYFAALSPYGLNIDDEGTLLYQIYRTYLGQILYIDFHAGYTPGIFLWNSSLLHLFGVNVVVLRLCLAVVNGLAVYCMYWLGRQLGTSPFSAAVAGLAYLAFIPFYDGQFGAFNIPYPIWYGTLFWFLSVISAVRWWQTGRSFHWLVAGLCSGAVFSFKPNSGLLNLAGLLMALVFLQRPGAYENARGIFRRLLLHTEHLFRWFIPASLALGLTLFFLRGAGSGMREVMLFALPLVIVAAYQLLAPGARAMARPVAPLRIWGDLILLGLGFAVIVVPWVVYFWSQLGTAPFLRAILFIGTNFDRFYYLPYPLLSTWEMALTAGMALLWAVGIGLRRGWIPRGPFILIIVGGGLAAAALLVKHPPPMVEGFQPSVVMRVRHLALGLVLIVEWIAILAYATLPREPVPLFERGGVGGISPDPSRPSREPIPPGPPFSKGGGRERRGVLLILLLSAVLMHMQIYPRTDFMHLVPAAPGVLILGAWLLDRLADQWAHGLARSSLVRRAAAVVVVSPVYVLIAVLIAPALLRIEYLARAWWENDQTALVWLESRRAPLVVEPAAGRPFLSLSAASRYLQENSRPDDFVFTFPAIDIVSFLADRHNPTRHGYFFPGWPGHEVEAEVIDALQARPPRYIVALHDHALYFVAAPVYYFNLRQYVTSHYTLERRVGTFDLLRPVGGANTDAEKAAALVASRAPASAPQAPAKQKDGRRLEETIALWRRELQHRRDNRAHRLDAALASLSSPRIPQLATAIGALDPDGQRAMARLIRKSRSPSGAAALSTLLVQQQLEPTVRELLVRVIAETGDARAAVPLLKGLPQSDVALQMAIAGNLYLIASRWWVEDYWFVPPDHRLGEIRRIVDAKQLANWMDNPSESIALRSFAIRLAAYGPAPDVTPSLLRVLRHAEEYATLRADAAYSLVHNGLGLQILPIIGGMVDRDDLLPTVLLVQLYPEDPPVARRFVREYMASSEDSVRAKGFWIAAAVRDPGLVDAVKAGLNDPFPEVRMAAAWTLGNMGVTASVDSLRQLTSDGNEQVAQYAQRALRRIGLRTEDRGL